MYNILNPLHYVAANRPEETINILTGKFGLATPQTMDDFITSIDFATQQYGDAFIEPMLKLHPDTPQIIIANGLQAHQLNYSNMIEDSYKTTIKGYTSDQLNAELATLNTQLLNVGTTDEPKRADILEKIKYVQEALLLKLSSSSVPASATAQNALFDIHKTNNYLLLGLTAFALILLGSQIKISKAS